MKAALASPSARAAKSCGNTLPFKIQFLWRGLMKKSSDYQTLQLSPASFPPACCPGLPCRRPRRWGQNHQLLEATIFSLIPPSFLYPVHLGRLWFSLELSAVFPKSSFHIATSFTNIWDLQQFGPPEARVSLQSWAVVLCAELWAPAAVSLPAVDQFFAEPAGQRLAHPVEQFGQLYVVIPVVLPEERLRLKQTTKVKKTNSKEGTHREEKGTYLSVHVRVSASFTLSQTLGLSSLQQLTPEAFLRIKPVHDESEP